MKRILITGAGSYIGQSVKKYLLSFDGEYAVDTLDMIDPSWKDYDFSGYDSVLHVAAIVHRKDKNDEQSRQMYDKINNVLAVNTAKKAFESGVGQFIFISTTAVYGTSSPIGGDKMITADTPIAPENFYGISKANAESGISELDCDSFRVVIIRPPIIYGRNCKGNYVLLSKLAQKMPVFPLVDNRKSMIYIDNFCEFIRLMIKNNEHGVFMPQNSEYVNTTDMVRQIALAHNKKILITSAFNFMLKFAGLFTNKVSKAFGSITYRHEISEYKEDYNIVGFEESIRISEGVTDD